MNTYKECTSSSRKALLEFAAKHADASTPLDNWYRIAKKGKWKHLDEVRKTFPYFGAREK